MFPKYHEQDDIFALKFMPELIHKPHIEVTIPPSPLTEGRHFRVIAPSRGVDDHYKVTGLREIRKDDGHFDVVEAQRVHSGASGPTAA